MIISNIKKSKFESPFSIKILDDDFNLVTIINYKSLQWDRMFNQVGKFVIDGVTGGKFNRATWKYVYSEKRRELGIISQVNWKKEGSISNLTLSGLFAENELNKMICYQMPTAYADDAGVHYGTSILKTGAPLWATAEGTADQVARAFFNGFKQISFRNYLVGDFEGTREVDITRQLDISFGSIESGVYKYAIHNRNNEPLANKLYNILKESAGSIEVVLDYDNRTMALNILHGVDRTQAGHAQGVNPIVFTSANGSIKTANIVTSNTDTKDAVIQYSSNDEQTLILVNALPDCEGRFVAESMGSSQNDFINEETVDKAAGDKAHKLSVMADASTFLLDARDVLNIEFDFVTSSYKYIEDYDLGDIVSIDIPEIDISVDAQIVACHEVVKSGVWSMSIEVGKTILRKRGTL